jgi:hypothetical protein
LKEPLVFASLVAEQKDGGNAFLRDLTVRRLPFFQFFLHVSESFAAEASVTEYIFVDQTLLEVNINGVSTRGERQFVRSSHANLPSGHQVIVVDHFDEWFNLVSASLFLLSHSFRYLAWITADTSDHGVAIASFIATFVVWLERGNGRRAVDRLDAYFDHYSLAACVAAGQDYNDFLTLHNFHHGWDEKEI